MLPREYPNLYIDGRWQEPDSNERLEVISPSTGEKIGYVPAGTRPTSTARSKPRARRSMRPTGRLARSRSARRSWSGSPP